MRFKHLHLVEKNVDDENIEFETFQDPYLRFFLKNELFKIQRVEKQDEIIGSSELKDELSLNNPE